jgi:hypothetical protein
MCSVVTDGWNYQDNMLPKYHKRLGHDVTIVTSHFVYDNKGQLAIDERNQYVNEHDVKVIRLKSTPKKQGSRLKKFPGLYNTIVNEHPDILFVHCPQFRDSTTVVKYMKKHPNVKLFVDNHADFSNSASGWLSKKVLHGVWWKYYARLLVPYATKFYGVLPARVDFLVEQYGIPKEKVKLLVMGADDDYVEAASIPESINGVRNELGLDPNNFVIVTGGKIDKAKTQTMLLMEAVKNINRENIKLVVFGSVDAELKERFMSLVDGEKVKYIGWIDSSESYRYFACADLVCFPGRHSVFWEQVAGQGIPMLVKYWTGTTHVDCGGNVKFIEKDSMETIISCLDEIASKEKYQIMKVIADNCKEQFLYSEIARRSIEK